MTPPLPEHALAVGIDRFAGGRPVNAEVINFQQQHQQSQSSGYNEGYPDAQWGGALHMQQVNQQLNQQLSMNVVDPLVLAEAQVSVNNAQMQAAMMHTEAQAAVAQTQEAAQYQLSQADVYHQQELQQARVEVSQRHASLEVAAAQHQADVRAEAYSAISQAQAEAIASRTECAAVRSEAGQIRGETVLARQEAAHFREAFERQQADYQRDREQLLRAWESRSDEQGARTRALEQELQLLRHLELVQNSMFTGRARSDAPTTSENNNVIIGHLPGRRVHFDAPSPTPGERDERAPAIPIRSYVASFLPDPHLSEVPARDPATTERCEGCGAISLSTDAFCASCGRNKSPPTLERCGTCGSLGPVTSAFCGQCGRLKSSPGASASAATPTRPPPERHFGARDPPAFADPEGGMGVSPVERLPDSMFGEGEAFEEFDARHREKSASRSSSSSSSPPRATSSREPLPFLDTFGPASHPARGDETNWHIDDETLVYKDKELDRIKVPDLPDDACRKRGWDAALSTNIGGIDRSADDVLVRWLVPCLDPQGKTHDVCSWLHTHSQGLNRLDRYLGQLMAATSNLNHKLFSSSFASYIEWCRQQRSTPKGRVFIALVSFRFRLDRARGNTISQVQLLQTPLVSYKMSDVRLFISKVRTIMSGMADSDLKDKPLLFQWLWEKFRSWSPIASKTEKIRESGPTSHRRTWNYLWHAITTHLDQVFEDENYNSISRGIAGQPTAATPARTKGTNDKDKNKDKDKDKKDKKEKKNKDQGRSAGSSTDVLAVPGKGIGKGKGKPKGEGKGKSAALEAALATAPRERTPQQCKLITCRFQVTGTCLKGDSCPYSHAPKAIAAEKNRFKGADGKLPSHAMPAEVTPQGKAKAKGPKSAAVAAGVAATAGVVDAQGAEICEATPDPAPSNASSRPRAPQHPYLDKTSFYDSCCRTAGRVRRGFTTVATAFTAVVSPNVLSSSSSSPFNCLSSYTPIDLASTMPAAVETIVVAPARLNNVTEDKAHEIEFIMDSGAGKDIASLKEFGRQGIKSSEVAPFVGKASSETTFYTGGGVKVCNQSIGVQSDMLGSHEINMLQDSPCALSMGNHVGRGHTFVWPDTEPKPFFVTHPKKCTIICPYKYRNYADRVENGVPIWRDKVVFFKLQQNVFRGSSELPRKSCA